MGLYLVLLSTLGAIRGVHVREFVEGETVDLDDDDLAAVGCRDGWLTPVDDLSGAPAAPAVALSRYTLLQQELLPPQSDWGAPPRNGDVIELSEEAAAPLIALGAIQLTVDSGPHPGGQELTAVTGITETDEFPEDYTQYVALQGIQIDESGDLLLPGDRFGMSAEQAVDWLEVGLIALAPAEDVAPATTRPSPPGGSTTGDSGGVEDTHKLPQQAAPLEGGTPGHVGEAGSTPDEPTPPTPPQAGGKKKKSVKAGVTEGGVADGNA